MGPLPRAGIGDAARVAVLHRRHDRRTTGPLPDGGRAAAWGLQMAARTDARVHGDLADHWPDCWRTVQFRRRADLSRSHCGRRRDAAVVVAVMRIDRSQDRAHGGGAVGWFLAGGGSPAMAEREISRGHWRPGSRRPRHDRGAGASPRQARRAGDGRAAAGRAGYARATALVGDRQHARGARRRGADQVARPRGHDAARPALRSEPGNVLAAAAAAGRRCGVRAFRTALPKGRAALVRPGTCR